MSGETKTVIAVAGNPNSGKTTLFNGLTGSRQRVGNWPGVTVEKKIGSSVLGGAPQLSIEAVDLPGIYSLSSYSEDERIARDYLLSREADLVLNVVDASNLERNLFLTLNLVEMRVPLVVVLNMMDLAEKRGLTIDPDTLSRTLGVPVLAVSAVKPADIRRLKGELAKLIGKVAPSPVSVSYPASVEACLDRWSGRLRDVAVELGTDQRWLGIKVLEGDEYLTKKVGKLNALDEAERAAAVKDIEAAEKDAPDSVIASAKYAYIADAVRRCRTARAVRGGQAGAGQQLDRVVLNRFLGLPIFLGIMYLLFWIVINVGGSFIDFFDIAFGAVFVDGFGRLLEGLGSPVWLTAFLAGGIGAGIQTMATFVPIMFAMFFMLAFLEDSGYMARAAFVMDRLLRAIGLPGKAFIPMIVGFGCSVPAIMATRTLENKRDRYLTVFMVPFMSCGARLPVYALFGAAFFARNAGAVVLSLYLVGILLAVATGFMLKTTLFRGETSPFVMELPSYHFPRFIDLLKYSWIRLKAFAVRAGTVIVITVAVLGLFNSVGTDGSFGNEDSETSVLAAVGQAITPVFTPMGIQRDNWPATVGLFTGLFAKEAVVGTLNGLYGQLDAAQTAAQEAEAPATDDETETEEWSLFAEFGAAFASIGDAFSGLAESILDPLGLSLISGDEAAVAEGIGADEGIFSAMRGHFHDSPHAAYAYLLFVLIYFPCLAALGALVREIGPFFGWVSVIYLTVLAWITATLYYQLAEGGQILWIAVALVLLALTVTAFALMRRRVVTV